MHQQLHWSRIGRPTLAPLMSLFISSNPARAPTSAASRLMRSTACLGALASNCLANWETDRIRASVSSPMAP